ncbi:MAG: DUF1552 domain-containing protein [Deltaproteobacteria bacterium]|nr:DUF1552 domain-containing protein [Deltaproteobacteria bacterium]
MSRRTLLRGTGTAAIALPFLDEMRATSVWAGEPAPPARAFNLFFGLGIPRQIAAGGLVGPLAPLAAVADKLAICRGVNMYECDGPENNHFDGAGGTFTGREPATVSQAGGPSIDQAVLGAKYPQGPDTLITTLMMGSFFRRKLNNDLSLTRFVHCWNEDGSPVDVPIETPTDLFERVFGDADIGDGPEDLKAKHYERSVLDSVLEQYQHYTGPASPLGASSRSRVADHLDKVRELEQKLFPEDLACAVPGAPAELPLLGGQDVDGGGGGPTLQVNQWVPYWQSMAELYAMAVQCDVTRFGMVMFQSAGERIRLQGDWDYNGQTVNFDDVAHPVGNGASHEYWHAYTPGNAHPEMLWHTHFFLTQLVYFMQLLDDPEYADANDKTILDNALITIGTELGDGNPHNLESVFHAVSGANGRIRTGEIFDFDASCTELYTTLLAAMDIDQTLGTPSAFNGLLSQLLV